MNSPNLGQERKVPRLLWRSRGYSGGPAETVDACGEASETICCEGTVLVTGDSQRGERCVLELVLFSVRVAWVVGHIVLRICWSWL